MVKSTLGERLCVDFSDKSAFTFASEELFDPKATSAHWDKWRKIRSDGQLVDVDEILNQMKSLLTPISDEEKHLILGEIRSMAARWQGDLIDAKQGLREMQDAIVNKEWLRKNNRLLLAFIQGRIGKAYTRIGFLTRDHGYLTTAEAYLDHAIEALEICLNPNHPEYSKNHLKSKRQILAEFYRDKAEVCIGFIHWHNKSKLENASIDCIKKSLELLHKEKECNPFEEVLTLATLAFIQARYVSLLSNQPPLSKTVPSQKSLISSAQKNIALVFDAIKHSERKKGADFRLARAGTYIGFAVTELLNSGLRSSLSAGLYCFKYSRKIYKNNHLFRYAITLDGLSALQHSAGNSRFASIVYVLALEKFLECRNQRFFSCMAAATNNLNNLTPGHDLWHKKRLELLRVQNRAKDMNFYEYLQNDFDDACDPSSFAFEHLAPTPPPITKNEIKQIEKLLGKVRRIQEAGDLYNPPEGRKAFCKKITAILKAHNLCIPLKIAHKDGSVVATHARSITVIGDYIKVNANPTPSMRGGARSLVCVSHPVKIKTAPQTRRLPKIMRQLPESEPN